MFGQFVDDFSDGDFTNSPEWSGLHSKFVVSSQQLKLQALPGNDFAYLATSSKAINDASWEFFVSLEFNPSGTNFARIYLVSDQPNLHDPVNGYFVQLGNTADDVSLYKQSGVEYTKIIDGVDQRLDSPSVAIRIKVTRDTAGLWELWVDPGSTGTYVSEGTVTDTTHSSSQYVGIICSYTFTRSDKFGFDDFVVTGSPSLDNTPPTIDSVAVTSSNELLLAFSEILDPESSRNMTHYRVNHSIAHPANATVSENKRMVRLLFDVPFSPGISYTLDISGISDVAGNLMIPATRKFQYLPPTPGLLKDIIFTEILADPSPKIGLPEVEFIELFNRSERTYNLEGWKVMDEHSLLILPALVISPGEYFVIAPDSTGFSGFKNVLADDNFPSLNNSGDVLQLRDFNDLLVDSIHYSNNWYKDDDRSFGGWSLELIDPDNICSDFENWIASEDPAGGTPGKQNSVFANKPDLSGPMLQSAFPSNSTSLRLTFNEKLEKLLPDVSSFTLDPAIEITGIAFTDQSLTQVQLSLADELQPCVTYSIHIRTTYDCAGNSIDPDFNNKSFGLPEAAQPGDIVINEVLFNPKPGGVDFIELVNNSHKFLNLKNWSLGIMHDGVPSSLKPLMARDYLVKPGVYLVLTEDFYALKGQYQSLEKENVLVLENMPSLSDDKGSVVVIDDQGNIIDYFQYSEDLHSVFINDEEGVSLERIALDRPTNEHQNWKSASSIAGFATPGFPNSNAIAESSVNEETVKIEPEVFIPLVGQPEFAMIRYKFDKGGYVANVKIFDDQGHLIKRVASNEVLGIEGALRWDGDRDNGNQARIGYYMVWFEVFDNTGEVKTLRKRIAIATRFR